MFKHKITSCAVWKLILVIWIIFATLYVIYGEYGRLQQFVASRAYNQGITDAVTQLLDEAEKCQPIPVNVGERQTAFIAIECLQQPAEGAE